MSATVKAPPNASNIKSMKLYQNFERVDNEVNEIVKKKSFKKGNKLTADDLYPFDNMHYHGVAAVKEALSSILRELVAAGVENVKVLDVGSGLGGPARYMASELGCTVTAIELQKDCHLKAKALTERVGLSKFVVHKEGDILQMSTDDVGGKDFNLVVSWLVFLHIAEKEKLFKRCHEALKDNVGQRQSYMVFEDFYKLREFTPEEHVLLREEVFCDGTKLPTKEEYEQILDKAGFEVVKFEDMTDDWASFVQGRFNAYKASKDRHVRVHNEGTFQSQKRFFEVMDKLYAKGSEGNLGGVRVVCRKKTVV